MERKTIFAWSVGIVIATTLALLWTTRLQLLHLHRGEFVVLNRLTGELRYCDVSGCFEIGETPASTPQEAPAPAPPRNPYEDLIPQKK